MTPAHDPEFPAGASNPAGLSRKEFLRLMGASLALAGGGACTRQPPEKIVPYVRQPEGLIPGNPQWYATAMEQGRDVIGLLVKSHEGRPVKIEGNPLHSVSLGRTTVHAQAALLDLYDPDRSQVVRHRGQPSTWEDFLVALQVERAKWRQKRVGLLMSQNCSPLVEQQIEKLRSQGFTSYVHDAAFGGHTRPQLYDLAKADVIVSFDADFLGVLGVPQDTIRFASRRQPGALMNRLYVFESMPSLTGSMADHRFAMGPVELEQTALALALAVNRGGEGAPPAWQPMVRELLARRGRSLVLTGEHQTEHVRWAAQEINRVLGNPVYDRAHRKSLHNFDLAHLAKATRANDVTALIILDTNPVYSAAPEIKFADSLHKTFSVHCGSFFNETAAACEWHIPQSHFLESWGDAEALDGTFSLVQPLIEPLYLTKTKAEFLSALLGENVPAYELLRQYRAEMLEQRSAAPGWRKTLHDGTAYPSMEPAMSTAAPLRPPQAAPLAAAAGLEVLIRPDPHLLDGRFANNAWLQELPKPITGLTWGNAIHVSPSTAQTYHLQQGDEVELHAGGCSLSGPVYILPGHADGCATIHLGGGRSRAGRVGQGVGYYATLVQTSEAPWHCRQVELRATGKRHQFATTQHHQEMAGREPVRVLTIGAALPAGEKLESLYPAVKYTSPSWGMVIDLNACTGCGTCTIACQAENNIPVVGRAEVMRGRAMHWIRVDRYIEGGEYPRFLHQPVPCMHCENAPCEAVCPVAATVHDHQGLNLMVYNRCVGTRYCSNNCPYKVRRFNFFQYVDTRTPQLKLQRNPEVTVRERGVMEKCTYCVQRISAAQIAADVERRSIRDGEMVPACAQACPADAIVFGDILDPGSKVAAARRGPRHYALLEELNTRPRTTYLAKVTNPHPEMAH